MKTKHFFLRALLAMLVVIGTVPMLTSCEEEATTGGSDTSSGTGSMTMGGQTQDVVSAHIYSGTLDNGDAFQCLWLKGPYGTVYFGVADEASGVYEIETPDNVLDGPSLPAEGKAYCVIEANEAGIVIVSSGRLSVDVTQSSASTYTIEATGTTADGIEVNAQYSGTLAVSTTNPFEHIGESDDPDDPDDPSGNYVQYQEQSYSVATLLHTAIEGDNSHQYSLIGAGNEPLMMFIATSEITSGTYELVSTNTEAAIQCVVSVGEFPELADGTLTITINGSSCTLDFEGTDVTAHFSGQMTEIVAGAGVGSMTYGTQTVDISYGAMTEAEGFDMIVFTGAAGEDTDVTVAFGHYGEFSSGTFELINLDTDPTSIFDPTKAFCRMSVNNNDLTITGTLTLSVQDNTYTVTASGVAADGNTVSLNYEGPLSRI